PRSLLRSLGLRLRDLVRADSRRQLAMTLSHDVASVRVRPISANAAERAALPEIAPPTSICDFGCETGQGIFSLASNPSAKSRRTSEAAASRSGLLGRIATRGLSIDERLSLPQCLSNL